jgi:hypothetical protein
VMFSDVGFRREVRRSEKGETGAAIKYTVLPHVRHGIL